jgi:hypothetical protein
MHLASAALRGAGLWCRAGLEIGDARPPDAWYQPPMRLSHALLFTLLATPLATACDSDDGAAGGGEGDDAKASAEIELPKSGVKGSAPAGAKVSEMMGSDMVQAPGLVATVSPAKDDTPATGEGAQKEAEMYTPVDPKIEKLDDGYVLTFTNKGGMGENFWVQSYRDIGGTKVSCSTTANSKEQQDNAVAFCKSLKK